ncbi:hypothetical protein TNIN_227951 [Trichonephila inaurata madagascariensis]|uniref:Uncharacterized protein n=1 Tax=Trichonephila inaurata madagascariensis TaxID=2747483 RepID=A0A8X7CUE3_9ARAC|nr:hypothetical protein TNIN_227951 [Trichonephila inaurata madagascariensis]
MAFTPKGIGSHEKSSNLISLEGNGRLYYARTKREVSPGFLPSKLPIKGSVVLGRALTKNPGPGCELQGFEGAQMVVLLFVTYQGNL